MYGENPALEKMVDESFSGYNKILLSTKEAHSQEHSMLLNTWERADLPGVYSRFAVGDDSLQLSCDEGSEILFHDWYEAA